MQVSNLEKVMYPATGFTKAQVIDYYIRAARFILPHLKDRPYTLKRYPDGIEGQHFYEKNAPSHKPEWVKTFGVARKGSSGKKGTINYVMLNDLPSLVWVSNLASLEMHALLARAPRIDQPTFMVFDLDPGEPADVLDCARVAIWIRDVLAEMDLESFVKSSGSKGLQLYIPLNTSVTYEKTQPFAKAIADHLEKMHPERVVAGMAKNIRGGKVFIDWSQNTEHKTTVVVYSLRAKREQPYVSMPFAWDEVEEACRKNDAAAFYYTAEEALERMEAKGDLFEPVLTCRQKIPANYQKTLAEREKNALQDPNEEPRSKRRAKGASKVGSKGRLKGVGDRSLKAYEAKRDFNQTAEPAPAKRGGKGTKDGKLPMFVIQKHAASRLHFDFRLEMEGVLKSWAVPKGPPYTRLDKRLAMWVEDHPLDYATFEGTIPKGNYGAGTVMVWDIGTYEIMDGNIHQGKLHMMLHGKKLKGEWILVRGRKSDDDEKQPWFLIKGGETMAPPKNEDKSVLTKRTMEQITKDNDAQWQSNRPSSARKPQSILKSK